VEVELVLRHVEPVEPVVAVVDFLVEIEPVEPVVDRLVEMVELRLIDSAQRVESRVEEFGTATGIASAPSIESSTSTIEFRGQRDRGGVDHLEFAFVWHFWLCASWSVPERRHRHHI
jgi:hypothetical protein